VLAVRTTPAGALATAPAARAAPQPDLLVLPVGTCRCCVITEHVSGLLSTSNPLDLSLDHYPTRVIGQITVVIVYNIFNRCLANNARVAPTNRALFHTQYHRSNCKSSFYKHIIIKLQTNSDAKCWVTRCFNYTQSSTLRLTRTLRHTAVKQIHLIICDYLHYKICNAVVCFSRWERDLESPLVLCLVKFYARLFFVTHIFALIWYAVACPLGHCYDTSWIDSSRWGTCYVVMSFRLCSSLEHCIVVLYMCIWYIIHVMPICIMIC